MPKRIKDITTTATTAANDDYIPLDGATNGTRKILPAGLTPDATTTSKGIVELATDGESASGVVVQGNDSRLSNSRTPTAHQTTHAPGGTDALPWTTIHGRGTTASKPAAASTNAGYLYFDTTLNKLQRSTGSTWEDVSTAGTVTSVGGTGTVSGLSLSGTVTSSGSLTLGGTLAVTPSNFASQTANTVLAAPNGTAGAPTFRALVAADVPTLNQNTTGTAANVTGTVAVANGGTGATTASAARLALLPSVTSNGGKTLAVNSGATDVEWVTPSAPPTVEGPANTTIFLNVGSTFTITNYDTNTTYTLSTTNGTVTRSGATITFTPTTAGTAQFTINGKTITGYTATAPQGQQAYTTAGTYTWTAPEGVTKVSVFCVGGGGAGHSTSQGAGGGGGGAWKNEITVTPGTGYTVVVGAAGTSNGASGAASTFTVDGNVQASGGGGTGGTTSGGVFGNYTTYTASGGTSGGATGGRGGNYYSGVAGGGGGAGGYAGWGGDGYNASNDPTAYAGTSGCGGGGGYSKPGGGVGILGQGSSGAAGGFNAAGGAGSGGSGTNFGGGGASTAVAGGGGAVRIIWGTNRAYPSTNTANV